MASVRIQLRDILKIDGIEAQLREAMDLLDRLDLEKKKPLALVYNFVGDLFMSRGCTWIQCTQKSPSKMD